MSRAVWRSVGLAGALAVVRCSADGVANKEAASRALVVLANSSYPGHYNCVDELANWRSGWSEPKKQWCCKHANLGCPAEKFDCSAGFLGWETGWSTEMKEWCCKEKGRGCTQTDASGDAYDCEKDLADWVNKWSPSKKAWCCKREGRRWCSTEPYSCVTGFSNWRRGWSDSKKDWCCQKKGLGCVEEEFDCGSDIDGRRVIGSTRGWSAEKARWCCSHRSIGCGAEAFARPAEPESPASPPALAGPAAGDLAEGAGGGSGERGQSASASEQPATRALKVESSAPPEYKCSEDLSEWKQKWSAAKHEWCCEHEVDCTKPPFEHFECKQGVVSDEQQEWCCQNQDMWCKGDQRRQLSLKSKGGGYLQRFERFPALGAHTNLLVAGSLAATAAVLVGFVVTSWRKQIGRTARGYVALEENILRDAAQVSLEDAENGRRPEVGAQSGGNTLA